MAMNYDFCISPLSTHVMDHLVPLIPIFKGKDLYVLLVTISKIMQGRDENRNVFFYTSKNEQKAPQPHLRYLLDKSIQDDEHKDLSLALSLVLKELFGHSEIIEEIKRDKVIFKQVEKFLIQLARCSDQVTMIEEMIQSKKTSNPAVMEFKGRSEILGFEIDLINKSYQPIKPSTSKKCLNLVPLGGKIDMHILERLTTERTVCMYLKNECYFLIGIWIKLNPDNCDSKIFEIYIKLFFSLMEAATQELEVIELMTSLTNSDILTLSPDSKIDTEQGVSKNLETLIVGCLDLLKSPSSNLLPNIKTNLAWILSAIEELNYKTPEVSELYKKLEINEFLNDMPEYHGIELDQYEWDENFDEEKYDEEIRKLQEKLENWNEEFEGRL